MDIVLILAIAAFVVGAVVGFITRASWALLIPIIVGLVWFLIYALPRLTSDGSEEGSLVLGGLGLAVIIVLPGLVGVAVGLVMGRATAERS